MKQLELYKQLAVYHYFNVDGIAFCFTTSGFAVLSEAQVTKQGGICDCCKP